MADHISGTVRKNQTGSGVEPSSNLKACPPVPQPSRNLLPFGAILADTLCILPWAFSFGLQSWSISASYSKSINPSINRSGSVRACCGRLSLWRIKTSDEALNLLISPLWGLSWLTQPDQFNVSLWGRGTGLWFSE